VVSSKILNAVDESVILTSITTPSDEAFLLLLIENSEECWSFCSRQQLGITLPNEVAPHAKYTLSPSSKQSGKTRSTKRNGGWSSDGISRFNSFVTLNRRDKKKFGQWFDRKLHNALPSQFSQQSASGNTSHEGDSEVVVNVRAENDLCSDDDEDIDVYHSDGSERDVEGQNQVCNGVVVGGEGNGDCAGEDGDCDDGNDNEHTRDIWESQ